MNILQINSSARTTEGGSQSSRLAAEFVARLLAERPDAQVALRDLARQPHPQLDEAALQALFTPAEQRTPEQSARVAIDDALIAEVMAADVIVLGVPMYNFGISTQLKAWLDALARARVTFEYTANGPVGLVRGKKVYAVLTRGGKYRGTPHDTQVPYLRSVLGFLGMTDVECIYAEGLNMGPEAAAAALAGAREEMTAVLAGSASEPVQA